MTQPIDRDLGRFKDIAKGKVRKELKKFMGNSEMIGRVGKNLVSIPIPFINPPHFHHGNNDGDGVGSGEGKEGDVVGGDPGQGSGKSKGGDGAGKHILEVDIALEELADILGEELKLQRMKPRKGNKIRTEKERYTSLHRTGPESLRHMRRTFKNALLRFICSHPIMEAAALAAAMSSKGFYITQEDKRYRSWKVYPEPENRATIIYMMDVSGSMGDEQKALVRLAAFWTDLWIQRNYKGVESCHIVFDVHAGEVTKDVFYSIKEDGGTKISAPLKLALKIIKERYLDSNIYMMLYSDGDNSSEADNKECIKIIQEDLLPKINLFGYSQVASGYGNGNFFGTMQNAFGSEELVRTAKITGRDDILDAIKAIFGEKK